MQTEPAPGGGRFLFNVNLVFFSQVVIYGLAFALRVVLARGLGDEGLGEYSLFFVTVLVAGGIANLGVGLGNIYYLNKGTYRYENLLSNSIFVLGVTSIFGWLLLLAYALIHEPSLFVSGSAFWVYGAALPAMVAYVLFTSFLHGSSRFVALSGVAISQGLVAIVALGVLYAAGELTVFTSVSAWTGSFFAASLFALAATGLRRVDLAAVFRPSWTALGDQIRYGMKGQVANLAQLFNYRLDQYLVAAFVSFAGVGHYTVAVGLAESVWWISSAVAMVLLPRLTAMKAEDAADFIPVACRNTLVLSVVAAVLLMIVSPVAIPVLFGEDFEPAVLPLILLMPGIVAASATRVLGSYLFSQGHIIYNTYATFIALGVTIGLDLVLIPLLQVEGAAIASSIAYTVALGATLHWYRRVSGRGILEALVLRASDIRLYADTIQRLRTRASA